MRPPCSRLGGKAAEERRSGDEARNSSRKPSREIAEISPGLRRRSSGALFRALEWRGFPGASSMEQAVTFGRYRFDASTGQLWFGKREVRLTPKSAGVLAALVQRAGELVTKQDLFATLWPDVAVTDDALTSCIQELRRALADDAKQPRFIETRHRRGYRFIASLSGAFPAESTAPRERD